MVTWLQAFVSPALYTQRCVRYLNSKEFNLLSMWTANQRMPHPPSACAALSCVPAYDNCPPSRRGVAVTCTAQFYWRMTVSVAPVVASPHPASGCACLLENWSDICWFLLVPHWNGTGGYPHSTYCLLLRKEGGRGGGGAVIRGFRGWPLFFIVGIGMDSVVSPMIIHRPITLRFDVKVMKEDIRLVLEVTVRT